MTLGERIMTFRTERQMSQSDLAEALDVSRQSISKWETDSSVPELEKLIALCDIFGVSMDVLVRGIEEEKTWQCREEAEHNASAEKQEIVHVVKLETQKIAGILLFVMAMVWIIIGTLLGDILAGFTLAVPFIICGIICLILRKRAGLWCAWVIAVLGDWFLGFATGAGRGIIVAFLKGYVDFSINVIIGIVQLVLILALVCFTIYSFRKEDIRPVANRDKCLVGGWISYVVLWGIFGLLMRHLGDTAGFIVSGAYSIVLISGQQLLFIWFVTLLVWTYHWWRERCASHSCNN